VRLSEAILLGDSLKKPNSMTYIPNPSGCCAIGGALLAIGVTRKEFLADVSRVNVYPAISLRWPWLNKSHIWKISSLYGEVEAGEKTIEQLADYVRSIEPPEPTAGQVGACYGNGEETLDDGCEGELYGKDTTASSELVRNSGFRTGG
jgi:hypothetical protein